MDGYKTKKAQPPSSTSSWDFVSFCCPQRTEWWRGIVTALVVIMCILGLIAFIVCWITLSRTSETTTQIVYPLSSTMRSVPSNQVLAGTSPITLTVPNDLSPYVGRVYHFVCDTAHAHSLVITAGALPTTWTGVANVRTATCPGGGPGGGPGGFSFQVYGNSKVRVFGENGMVFS